MPPDPRGLTWTALRDFTPGIFSNLNPSSGQPTTQHIPSGAPPGAADENGTFRCCAGPGGGLTAVPGVAQVVAVNPPGGSLTRPLNQFAYLTGFYVKASASF